MSRKFLPVAALALFLGACGMTSGPAAEQTKPLANKPNAPEVSRNMAKAMEDVKSASILGKIDAKVEDTETKESVKINLTIASKHDARTEGSETLSLNLKAGVDGTMNTQPVKGELDVDAVVIAKDGYVRLNSVSLASGELTQFQSIIDEVKGKWYIFAGAIDQAKGLAMEQGAGGFADSFAGDNATPEQQAKMRALVERTNFFESTVDDSSVSVDGVDTYKVTVKLNKPEIVSFMKEAAKINGEEVSADDTKSLEEGLAQVDFQGVLYIGVADKLLYRMTGTITPVAGSDISKDGNFTVSLDLNFSNYNKDQGITAPAGAVPFDLEKIMGGGAVTE